MRKPVVAQEAIETILDLTQMLDGDG